MKKFEERRKFDRFPVKEKTFALLKPSYSKIGQVVDIGLGGLAFNYLPSQSSTMSNDDQNSVGAKLSIISMSGELFFDSINVHIVSDCLDSEFHQKYKLTMKRCCLKFDQPDSRLQDLLNKVIENQENGL